MEDRRCNPDNYREEDGQELLNWKLNIGNKNNTHKYPYFLVISHRVIPIAIGKSLNGGLQSMRGEFF